MGSFESIHAFNQRKIMKAIHPLLEQETAVEVVDDSNKPWLLVRCLETDFHFISNPPTCDRLSEEFAWEKTIESERERRNQTEPVIRFTSELAKKLKFLLRPNRDKMFQLAQRTLATVSGIASGEPIKALDVGCGNGKKMMAFCNRFQQRDINVVPFGIEVSSELARQSRERFDEFGGDVVENNAIDGMQSVEPGSIDLVTMLSFLEHESRPLQLLKAIRNALKPGGSVTIKVPNFASWNRKVRGRRWAGFRFPDHVSYFTPASLMMLANKAGFELVPQKLTDKLPTNDNMYAVLKKSA